MMRFLCLLALVLPSVDVWADGPADNNPALVRRIPRLGIEVTPEQRADLEAGLANLRTAIQTLLKRPDRQTIELLPDVEIYYKAVHDALAYQEFFDPKDIAFATTALATGLERADRLGKGEAPWTTASGLVVRGYVSRIDGSVQPYGLVVPESYTAKTAGRYRCDLWFHGRGETLSELNFIRDRTNNPGTFTPADTFVLHPYGRYSNAFKFAGETDVLEALDSVRSRYRVDDERTSVRGFSMGGAAAWHFAVHFPDRWFAANPGAGFSETPEFLKVFQKEELQPTWWEQKLWQWYDCPGYALNLRYCPTVAYSGELDSQKQAADVMERALAQYRIELMHIIGPGTKHAYERGARDEVERRMSSLAALGRQRNFGRDLDAYANFVTYTLRYNRLQWLTIDGLGEHWRQATISAIVRDKQIDLNGPQNVTDLTIDFPAGHSPFSLHTPVQIVIDKQTLEAGKTPTDRSFHVALHKAGDAWQVGPRVDDGGLRKRHGLQGPIDDAFMDSFIFVRPTGKPWHELSGKWAAGELERAIEHWRRHYRGTARVKDDVAVTDADLLNSNVVLWGDPSSNQVLARIADRLPIAWTSREVTVGGRKFPADTHAVISIYPNPLNPHRYVVLNSSFTFRDFAYLNNARQVPMLPDWAIVDLTTPPGTVWPGKIVLADFFDERWQLKAEAPAVR